MDSDDVDGIAEARRAIDHPVSEHVRSLVRRSASWKARAVDIFNISITVAGGIRGMQQLFDIATAANIECLIRTTQELRASARRRRRTSASRAPRLD